ncbi:hypothetical protein, partial [Clostridium perfringens]|uniref:hypothetical protein n=1 Tax=Clostridium perfringens TaxID=1502 RepID=UPI0037550ECE
MENLILHEIFKITQYNTNRVILNKFYRDSISESLGIKDQTVRNAISKLRRLDFLIKEGVGVYIQNLFLLLHYLKNLLQYPPSINTLHHLL